MKQIRRGTFETNSSTQHALVFSSDISGIDVKAIIGGKKLVFGKNQKGDIDLSTWQSRADSFYSSLSEFSFVDGLEYVKIILDVFKSIDVEVEFSCLSQNIWYGSDICTEIISPENTFEENKKNLISFIFGENVYYSSLCDEGCPIEKIKNWREKIEKVKSKIPEDNLFFITDRS